jgi:hypothetical protein
MKIFSQNTSKQDLKKTKTSRFVSLSVLYTKQTKQTLTKEWKHFNRNTFV